MDAGLLRGLYTLFMFIVFVGIVWWAWSSRRKQDFDEAAALPLEPDRASPRPHGEQARSSQNAQEDE